jgi:hypothetical protein
LKYQAPLVISFINEIQSLVDHYFLQTTLYAITLTIASKTPERTKTTVHLGNQKDMAKMTNNFRHPRLPCLTIASVNLTIINILVNDFYTFLMHLYVLLKQQLFLDVASHKLLGNLFHQILLGE